jgi:hypothetical protein
LYDPDRTVFFGQVPPMLPNAYNTQQSQVLAHNPLPFMPIGSYFNQFQGYSNQNINNPNTLFGFQPPTPNTDYNTLRHSFVPSPIPSSTLNQYNNYQNHITSFQQHQQKSSIAYSQPSSKPTSSHNNSITVDEKDQTPEEEDQSPPPNKSQL